MPLRLPAPRQLWRAQAGMGRRYTRPAKADPEGASGVNRFLLLHIGVMVAGTGVSAFSIFGSYGSPDLTPLRTEAVDRILTGHVILHVRCLFRPLS